MLLKFRQRRLVLNTASLAAASLVGGMPLPASGAGKPVRIVTTHLPPLTIERGGEQDGQLRGALHEVVIELCKRIQVTPAIEFVPWKRATFLASSAAATGIFPLTRTLERERQYRWLVPLYDENYVFLAPRGRAFDVQRPANMKDMKITMLRGSSLRAVVIGMGYKHIVEARSIDEWYRFVLAGIADAAFAEVSVVRSVLRTKLAEAEFVYSAPVIQTSAWLAGSLDFTETQAASFKRAMKEMKADGAYYSILKRYQLG